MRILLLADTHVPGRARAVPAAVWDAVARADVVLHAGDFESAEVVTDFASASREFFGVRGNMDLGPLARMPDRRILDLAGIRVALVHGHQWGRPRPSRVAQEFASQADVVVFGHNHLPVVRQMGETWVVNPGSPTCPRGHEGPTYGVMTVDGSDIDISIVGIGD